jgi:hypothetical protein
MPVSSVFADLRRRRPARPFFFSDPTVRRDVFIVLAFRGPAGIFEEFWQRVAPCLRGA